MSTEEILFIVDGDGETHFVLDREIFTRASPIFAYMIEDAIDASSSGAATIELPDIPGDVFMQLRAYLKEGVVPNLNLYAIDLLQIADAYNLPSLKDVCQSYLIGKLTDTSSVDYLLTMAQRFNASILQEKALQFKLLGFSTPLKPAKVSN